MIFQIFFRNFRHSYVNYNRRNDALSFSLAVYEFVLTFDDNPAVANTVDELESTVKMVRDARYPPNAGTVDRYSIELSFIPKNRIKQIIIYLVVKLAILTIRMDNGHVPGFKKK